MKKNGYKSGIVGVKPVEISLSNKKEKKLPEKFFREAGKIWISLYGELVPKVNGDVAKPIFWEDGAEKRSLKVILQCLRVRAEEKNIEWTKEVAMERFEAFIRTSWRDRFVSSNFMLRIINNNKTKIFNNQITPKNGANDYRNFGESPRPAAQPKGGFGKL